MKENFYPKELTWESLGCKDDNASLTLLNAEINFYETIYNELKDNLEKYENIDCRLAIHDIKHRIKVGLPLVGFGETFINKSLKNIKTLRRILNIKVVEANEYSKQ